MEISSASDAELLADWVEHQREVAYVRLPDQSTRGVAAWMFDPAICAGVKLASEPSVECGALLELTRLLDRRKADARTGVDETTRKQAKEEAPGEA